MQCLKFNRLIFCISDVKGGEAGHWTELNERSGWSDSGTWNVATGNESYRECPHIINLPSAKNLSI